VALDFLEVSSQIEAMADQVKVRGPERTMKLDRAVRELHGADALALEEKRRRAKTTFLVPGITGPLSLQVPCPPTPPDFTVLASDGSHIDVSRHAAARCFLINIGLVELRYGAAPGARFESYPRLYSDPEEMAVVDPQDRLRPQLIEGQLLGIVRGIQELQALADFAESLPEDMPALALVDGTLILLSFLGQTFPDYVKRQLLQDEFLAALTRLRILSEKRPLGVAGYISLPGSTEVVNALRVSLCPYDPPDCDAHCRVIRPGERPCDEMDGLRDRDVLLRHLQEGDRSGVFSSQSSVVRDWYGEHEVRFFYVNLGDEIGRVEVPAWVAQDDGLLSLTHSLIVDQSRRGHGYPVALSEAHEQAVVNGRDRQEFARLVEESLGRRQLTASTSEKDLSKRLKWL
jgi:hypothetical protein